MWGSGDRRYKQFLRSHSEKGNRKKGISGQEYKTQRGFFLKGKD